MTNVGSAGGSEPTCDPGSMNDDHDLDGFSEMQGDCNDCDPNVGPNAMEVSTPSETPADEDCDGLIDEPAPTCDANLALGSQDAVEAARALDICEAAGAQASWGLVSAAYVRADGTAVQAALSTGLLAAFGDNIVPRVGARMLGLSSGHARDAQDANACGSKSCATLGPGNPPAGFPQAVPGCGAPPTMINDDIGLEIVLRAPANAYGLAFDFAFLSFEYPGYVCTPVNDQFVALVDPAPQGSVNGNISFDGNGNTVSINTGFLGHCDPATITEFASTCALLGNTQCPDPPNPYCPFGSSFLMGTGFDTWHGYAGATGWLTTTAPVSPNQDLSLRFAIWDTTDSSFDSTVLIDDFRWLATPASIVTTPVPE